ncbi:MFS transporter [Streptomyces sp. WMMC500]|uniref:MFS transporter n=1 Tax=Streptomyces sp. WMMC500 TaxID=3015154 RepID=UPI00248BD879|nr:MFS transporter [Streptomyces sp. WMMC500]WBB63045.1 MFS transporter [Streptomyces sp. WMMC500]
MQPARDTFPQRQVAWTIALAALTNFMVSLDNLVVATALPTLHEDLGGDAGNLSWAVNAYTLAFASLILTGTTLADRFGRLRVFSIGLTVFTVGSILCAVSPSLGFLIGARVVQGVGGGVVLPLTLALITSVTPPEERGKAIGIWGGVIGIAVASGPVVGGAIIQGFSWHWIFWLNVPIGLGVIALARMHVPESFGGSRKIDPVGLLMATSAVLLIVQALIRGPEREWTEVTILGGLVVGPLLLVCFVLWERRVSEPMISISLFRNLNVSAGCVSNFILNAGMFGPAFLLTQYIQLGLGNSPVEVGVRLLPWTALTLVISPFVGQLADRIGERYLVTVGLLLPGVAFLWIGWEMSDSPVGYGSLWLPLLFAGAGTAIAFPSVSSAVMRSVTPKQAGMASGSSETFAYVGAVFGVAMVTAWFAAFGDYGTAASMAEGIGPALVGIGVLSVVGAIVAVLVIRQQKMAAPDHDEAFEPAGRSVGR